MSIIENKAGKIKANFNLMYSLQAFSMYEAFNSKPFAKSIKIPRSWIDLTKFLYNSFNYKYDIEIIDNMLSFISNSKKIVVAFSGGLDSMYQAFFLRDKGYDVYLLHVSNINKYTNGQERKVVEQFAKDFNFPLEIVEFSSKSGHKQWSENPFKTCLCYSICLDYACEIGCNNISSGDDMRLAASDAVLDMNFGDCLEVTSYFFYYIPFNFIKVEDCTKDKRLEYLRDKGAIDYYYSCVGPGRINQYLHNHWQDKYNIKLDKYSCGCSCRKCAYHCLLDFYYNDIKFPQEFINKCWDKVAIGPDEVFFSKKLSLDKRIKNLLEY